MRVNQLAKQLGITADTVRYYTRCGFLKPKKNRSNGYKEYSEADENRLRFIVSARQLGFTVDDIDQIIRVSDKGKTPCPLVRKIIQQRLEETKERLDESLALRDRMLAANKDWERRPDKLPTGQMVCHLIENFSP